VSVADHSASATEQSDCATTSSNALGSPKVAQSMEAQAVVEQRVAEQHEAEQRMAESQSFQNSFLNTNGSVYTVTESDHEAASPVPQQPEPVEPAVSSAPAGLSLLASPPFPDREDHDVASTAPAEHPAYSSSSTSQSGIGFGTHIGLLDTAQFEAEKDKYVSATVAAAIRLSEGNPSLSHSSVNDDAASLFTSAPSASTSLQGSAQSGFPPGSSESAYLATRKSRRWQQMIEEGGIALLQAQNRGDSGNLQLSGRRRHQSRNSSVESDAATSVIKLKAAEADLNHAQILDIMRHNPDVLPVARAGVCAINSIAQHEFNFHVACEEGAIDELMFVVHRHEEDAELCASFCAAICSFSEWYDDRIGHYILALGVPSMVVNVMDKHGKSLEVQTMGCNALAAICGVSDLNRSACVMAGGPMSVHRAMTRNLTLFKDLSVESRVSLAKASLAAFARIAENNAGAASAILDVTDAASALLKVCGLESVYRMSDVFCNNRIEEDVVTAIEAVVFYEKGREMLVRSKGLRTVAAVMLRDERPEFLVRCCILVRTVALLRSSVDLCITEMISSGIIERLVTVLLASITIKGAGAEDTGARVAFEASQALAFVASYGSMTQIACCKVGAIKAARDMLVTYRRNPYVAKMGARVVTRLVVNNEESFARAEEVGMRGALQRAVEIHTARPSIADELRYALALFTRRDPTRRPRPIPSLPQTNAGPRLSNAGGRPGRGGSNSGVAGDGRGRGNTGGNLPTVLQHMLGRVNGRHSRN
jgi:hypothetical protein